MSISSSMSSNNYASFAGKSAPKAKAQPQQPQFGGEIFAASAMHNKTNNWIDALAKVFTGKTKVNANDPNDPNKFIEQALYTKSEKVGILTLLAGIPGLSALTALSSKGIYNGFAKAWNQIFNRAKFEAAPKRR